MEPLVKKPGRSEPTLTIYKSRISLNSRACFFLRLKEGSKVHFCTSGASVYVCNATNMNQGYPVFFRSGRKTAVVNSTDLAGELAYHYGGYGLYRIKNDVEFMGNGTRLFRIVHYLDE